MRAGLCLKVKMETSPLGGRRVPRGPSGTQAARVARGEGAHHATWRRRDKDGGGEGRVIETKADEGRVECVPSDKQEHGSSLRGAPGEH